MEFAVVGFVDFDDDGINDQDEIVEMIDAAGCKLAAIQDGNGDVHGEITPNVSFLVVEETDSPNPMLADARFNGVVPIEAKRFVHYYQKHIAKSRTH